MNSIATKIFLIIIGIVFYTTLSAQTVSIIVKDKEKNPVPGATVQFTCTEDSAKAYEVTGATGIAAFQKLRTGLYLVKISFIGYETLNKTISVSPERKNYNFQLNEKSIAIGEVTVQAKKPMITQEDDKMIVDPEPMISISTNTLEVLESTPGLFIDNDGGIFMTSATPAAVYINGREQKMGQQDIMTLLRSLPPGSVQRIEIMRTPSTRYDATSSGGIINIILKKGVKLGRFGTANMGMNQGKYGNRFGGFSFNNSGDKTTQYINVNYNYNDLIEELNSNRLLATDTSLHQSSDSRQKSHQGFLGYGINYDYSDKTSLNYDGRLNFTRQESAGINNNLIDGINDLLLSQIDNRTLTQQDNLNLQQDFGVLHKFDTLGSEWDNKFSYQFSYNNSFQEYETEFISPISLLLKGDGDNLQYRHFTQYQSDLTYQLPYKIKIETGIKSSLQNFTSEADYYNISGDARSGDTTRTNAFRYQEFINSAYFQASRSFGKSFLVKAGVRAEHTYMNGHQTVPRDTGFLVSRADLFPYVYLSNRIIRIMGLELRGYAIYRRTISRPSYQNLNPYVKYLDMFLYETGNPELKPQFTDNIECNISFEDMPIVAIGQNYTTDMFSSVVYQDQTQGSVAVMTYDNLGKNKETYFRGMAGIPPGGAYFFALGGQYNLNEYDGFYEGQPLSYTRGSWRFFTFHSLKLFKETKLTLSGFMMVNGQQNFYELKDFGSLNFGINQTLFDKKLTISLSARDVLRTMVTEFQMHQGGIHTTGNRYSDNQRFGINIRYNFGVSKKDSKPGFSGFENEE